MSLRTRTFISFLWQSAGTLGSGLVGLIVTMVLARNLTPQDFGTIEIILSFIVISEVLTDSGFSQAIIREKNITNSDLTGIFLINIIISFTIYLALYISAPFISSFFNTTSDFPFTFRILCLKILIDAFAISQIAECTRQMRFDIISQNSIIGMFFAGTTAILMALNGLGIWSLITYYLLLSFCRTILINIRMKWKPASKIQFSRMLNFFKFGGNLMLVQIIDKGITSIESLCVGKVYSKSELGIFSQARKLDNLIIQTLLGVVQKVSYPALSKVENFEALKSGYRSIMQLCFWVILPISMFSFFNPDIVICSLFGDQWLSAAPFLRIFSIYSMLIPLQSIGMNIFLVKNRAGLLRNLNLFKQGIRIIVILTFIHLNILIFTYGVVGVALIGALLYLFYSGRLINYTIPQIILDNYKTFVTSLVLGVFSLMLRPILSSSYLISFFIVGGLYTIFYVCISYMLKNEAFTIAISLIKEFKIK